MKIILVGALGRRGAQVKNAAEKLGYEIVASVDVGYVTDGDGCYAKIGAVKEKADVIICMSASHADTLEALGVDKLKCYVLGINDPFGGDINLYRECRDNIFEAVDELVEDGIL